VVKVLADHTIVMKTGRVVEEGPTEVFRDPKSDYTRASCARPSILRTC